MRVRFAWFSKRFVLVLTFDFLEISELQIVGISRFLVASCSQNLMKSLKKMNKYDIFGSYVNIVQKNLVCARPDKILYDPTSNFWTWVAVYQVNYYFCNVFSIDTTDRAHPYGIALRWINSNASGFRETRAKRSVEVYRGKNVHPSPPHHRTWPIP